MHYQTYQIALTPELDIIPKEFAIAWNGTNETQAIAEAHLSEAKEAQFEPIQILGILMSVETGVAINFLTDPIKEIIQRLKDKHTHIEQMKKPNGTEILLVDIDE
jgi:hypothetical protein